MFICKNKNNPAGSFQKQILVQEWSDLTYWGLIYAIGQVSQTEAVFFFFQLNIDSILELLVLLTWI